MQVLALLMPILQQLVLWLYDRAVTHYKSTALGTAIGAAVYATMTTFGCDPSLVAPAVTGLLAALPKILGSDADKIAPTLWQSVQDAVTQQKKSNQVMSDAVALQEQAKKDAGL